MARWLLATALLVAVACGPGGSGAPAGCSSAAPVSLVEVAIPPVSGRSGDFDAMAVDQAAHLLLVADRTDAGVDVLDITTVHPRYLGTAATGAAPSGVAVAPDLHRALAGLADGSVALIDIDPRSPSFLKVTRQATGAKRVDLAGYDADDHLFLAAAPVEGLLFALGGDGGLRSKVSLRPGLEQPAYNPGDHLVYVTASSSNSLWTVDLRTGAGEPTVLDATCSPAGLAINPTAGTALLGCSTHRDQVVTWDLKARKIGRVDTHAGGGDLAVYAAAEDRFLFAAGADVKGPEIAIFDGSGRYVTAVGLPAPSAGIAYDETNRVAYAADGRRNHAGLLRFAIPRC